MIKIHGYVDNVMRFNKRIEHCPRVGDTVRVSENKYAKVTEVVWCFDEQSAEGQRVNVRMETD